MAEFGLGAYLLDQGVLTKEQLGSALEAQVVYGGRLGTNLVELGLIELDPLTEHLSAMLGIPIAPKDWVDAPDPKALGYLPKELLAEHGILPLRIDATALHAAMLEPETRAVVAKLARSTGRSVVPYILPELRLRFALERHLGIPRPVRFVNVAKKIERLRRSAVAEQDPRPEEVRLREALGIRPLGADEDLIGEGDFAALHQSMVAARERAAGGRAEGVDDGEELVLAEVVTDDLPVDPTSAVALEAALAAAPGRDAAARHAIALARLHVEAAALLVVHRGFVMGLLGAGGDLERRIGAVLVPLDADSVFARAAATGEPYRGLPPESALDARVLRALARSAVSEMALLPIAVRGRVVNLLYVDHGAQPLAETALGALSSLTVCVARCYERLILARKSG